MLPKVVVGPYSTCEVAGSLVVQVMSAPLPLTLLAARQGAQFRGATGGSMQRWLIVLVLSVSLAPAAFAGGMHARIEGPDASGTYTARALDCDRSDTLEPWALAEGVVDGKRHSALIRLEPTREYGVYRFARTWPGDGLWMIRFCLGHAGAPATVVTLGADGSVQSNELFFHTDGSRECHLALTKALHLDPDDGC